jgi:hypothetical protein
VTLKLIGSNELAHEPVDIAPNVRISMNFILVELLVCRYVELWRDYRNSLNVPNVAFTCKREVRRHSFRGVV